ENATPDNRERLIWIAPWTGEMRSSTQPRKLLTNVTSDHVTFRQDLRDGFNKLNFSVFYYTL
ncbi:unnamed protein product, partial [Rotaria socialis]